MMDHTTFSQTMDIDVDFEGNQSYQPTRMLSTMFGNNHTFNFEDTEVTFEFTKYVQQLCNEMEEAKNRIDGTGFDNEAVKSVLNNLIDKVQQDMSIINNSLNTSLNATVSNQTVLNNTTISGKKRTTDVNNTLASPSSTKNETSILGLLADLFREDRHDKDPVENISKLNILSKSLKNLSANLTMNHSAQITANERSILKSIGDESAENKENLKNETFQESCNLTSAEMTFVNNSVCSPLMELLSAVEKKIDIERIEENLKANFEKQLKAKDELINEKINLINDKDELINGKINLINEKDKLISDKVRSIKEKDEMLNEKVSLINEKDDEIYKLKQKLLNLENNYNQQSIENYNTCEQLKRAKKEIEVLDEIISDEKRKLNEKQSIIEELHLKISENMDQKSKFEEKNIELKKELNRLSLVEKENQSLNEQVTGLLGKVSKVFELEKKIMLLNIDCDEKQSQINNISFELKSNIESNGRLLKEKTELMNRLDSLTKKDSDKAAMISELRDQILDSNAQLSIKIDRIDYINNKLKDTTALKNQLDRDRKDLCWQINDLLKNPDVDLNDLTKFLVLVEKKLSNVELDKPNGLPFIQSLVDQLAASRETVAGN